MIGLHPLKVLYTMYLNDAFISSNDNINNEIFALICTSSK